VRVLWLRVFFSLVLIFAVFDEEPAEAATCFAFSSQLNFGNIDMLSGTPHDTSDSVFLICFRNNPSNMVRACIHMGYNAADASQRYMDNGAGDLLGFQIYKDAARTQVWGSADVPLPVYNTYGPITLDFPPGSFFQVIPVYGRVPSGQTALPQGLYQSQLAGAAIGFTVKSEEYPSVGAAASCGSITTNSFGFTSTARANVLATCSVSTATMNFGTTGSLASAIDATTSIDVSCTNGANYNIGLNGGLSGAINPAARLMTLGPQQVIYGLYRNAARTLGWGNSIGTDTVSGTLGGTGVNNHTVYGRVQVQATPGEGTYTDTVIITLTY